MGEVDIFSVVAAYIDAGTGSYLLTALAGGFAAIWFFLRAKVDRLLGRTRKQSPSDHKSESAEESVGEETSPTAAETPPLKHE